MKAQHKTALVVTVLFAAAGIVNCGGDDSTPITPVDGSAEGASNEAGPDTSKADTSVADTSVADSSVDETSVGDGGGADGTADASDGFMGDAGCDTVGNPWHYVVDPTNGSDSMSSSGSGTILGNTNSACAFKTITHALAAIIAANNPPMPGTLVTVMGPSTVAVGETFPITLPKNVTIKGNGGLVTVLVPNGKAGFIINNVGGGLDTLTIDGQKQTGMNGVQVTTGADTTDVLNAVIIQNFASEGMTVGGKGQISINDGSQFLGNKASGLRIGDNSLAAITGKSTQILFKSNGASGVQVGGTGSVTISGLLGNSPPSSATVLMDGNTVAGLYISQTPNSGAPVCDVKGLAVVNTGAAGVGDGIAVTGGSGLKLRSSYSLSNALNGVSLIPGNNSTDYSAVDLGASNVDWGLNFLQDGTNQGAGLCVNFSVSLNANVKALGNNFGKNLDCSTTAAVLTHGNCKAGNKDTVGVVGNFNLNTVNVSKCALN